MNGSSIQWLKLREDYCWVVKMQRNKCLWCSWRSGWSNLKDNHNMHVAIVLSQVMYQRVFFQRSILFEWGNVRDDTLSSGEHRGTKGIFLVQLPQSPQYCMMISKLNYFFNKNVLNHNKAKVIYTVFIYLCLYISLTLCLSHIPWKIWYINVLIHLLQFYNSKQIYKPQNVKNPKSEK